MLDNKGNRVGNPAYALKTVGQIVSTLWDDYLPVDILTMPADSPIGTRAVDYLRGEENCMPHDEAAFQAYARTCAEQVQIWVGRERGDEWSSSAYDDDTKVRELISALWTDYCALDADILDMSANSPVGTRVIQLLEKVEGVLEDITEDVEFRDICEAAARQINVWYFG